MSLDLTYLGLTRPGKLYHNLPTARLYEEIVARGEGAIAQGGPMVVETATFFRYVPLLAAGLALRIASISAVALPSRCSKSKDFFPIEH